MLFVGNRQECILLNLHHYTLLSCITNLFAYIIGTQSDKSASVVEENNYTTKIINAYTVYDLDSWPKLLVTIVN